MVCKVEWYMMQDVCRWCRLRLTDVSWFSMERAVCRQTVIEDSGCWTGKPTLNLAVYKVSLHIPIAAEIRLSQPQSTRGIFPAPSISSRPITPALAKDNHRNQHQRLPRNPPSQLQHPIHPRQCDSASQDWKLISTKDGAGRCVWRFNVTCGWPCPSLGLQRHSRSAWVEENVIQVRKAKSWLGFQLGR